ncbi:MAG: hypothetical protein PSV46_20265, partial [Reyranella sp.]|nr:hypothetical protein [Reyranella sp.]
MIEGSTGSGQIACPSPVRMAGGPSAATSALQDAVHGGNLASTGRSSGGCRLDQFRNRVPREILILVTMANRFIEYRHLVAALLALLATLAALGAVDAQAQMPNQGLPIPDSPKQDLTAIDR